MQRQIEIAHAGVTDNEGRRCKMEDGRGLRRSRAVLPFERETTRDGRSREVVIYRGELDYGLTDYY